MNCFYLALAAALLTSIADSRAVDLNDGDFVYCGSASNGLAVMASSAQNRKLACPKAIRVGDSYLRTLRKGKPASVRIKVGGAVWTCQQSLHDTNPVSECVQRRKPREKVRLVS